MNLGKCLVYFFMTLSMQVLCESIFLYGLATLEQKMLTSVLVSFSTKHICA